MNEKCLGVYATLCFLLLPQQTVKARFFDVSYRLTLTGQYKNTQVDVEEEVIVKNRIRSQTNHLLELQPSSDWEFVQPETEVTKIQVCCYLSFSVSFLFLFKKL